MTELDADDILGHSHTLETQRGDVPRLHFSWGKAILLLGALWVIYVLGSRLWKRVLHWREQSYKLATRRRHGIPDSDLRPFNVAYSEAMARAREDEPKKPTRPQPSLRSNDLSFDQRDSLPDVNLRHRTVNAQQGLYRPPPVPTPYLSTHSRNIRDYLQPIDDHGPTPHVTRLTTLQSIPLPPSAYGSAPLARHSEYFDIENATQELEARKRTLDEQSDEPDAKKTRVEGDELIDGDENAEFHDEGLLAVPARGSKRGMREEEDGGETSTRKSRGKRARQVSLEKFDSDDEMEVYDDEEADEVPELSSKYSRGKKRDRAEAGSTFGNDDEDSDVDQLDDDKARRRRRKRRTVAKRKSEASYLRGKKRERDGNDGNSEEDSDEQSPVKGSRKKRGKHASKGRLEDEDETKSDVSMDESTISTRSKVRTIGDEWESNGIRWKIGPNGQRLRQALVKKARQKFVMPKDSQHPDRNANLQVCIESWLTEEEYRDAKEKHMLAWQDSPEKSDEPANLSIDISPGAIPFPRSVPGKNLLWSASPASTPTASPASYTTYDLPVTTRARSYPRHSIATSIGLPINPFAEPQASTVKRIASASRTISLTSSVPPSPGLSDSTNGSPRNPHKVFSKWEKQELEAKAMMKMREANRKKEMEREAKLKEERERVERERQEQERRAREQAEKARLEKERLEREKAEAEKKAKEAAVPTITVTAPSSDGFSAPPKPASTGPAFFTTTPEGGTKPAEPTTSAPKPNFFTSTTPAPATSAAPKFSFGINPPAAPPSNAFAPTPAAPSSSSAEQKPPADSAHGNIFSRLGPPVQSTTKPADSAKPAPMFSFNPPKPVAAPNPFSVSANTSSAPAANAAPANINTATTPKFNFGITTKPAAPPPTTSSLTGALGSSDPSKPATTTPAFPFKMPGAPASATTNPALATNAGASAPSSTPAATTAPKFTFGPSSNMFGGGVAASSAAAPSSAGQPAKPAFGTTSTPSPFGANTGSAFGGGSKPSVFGGGGASTTSAFSGGSSATPSLFSGASNAFGTKSDASAEPAKSPFGTSPAFSGGGAFGTTTTTTTTPAFGGGSSATNGVSNPFNIAGGGDKPAEGTKSTFNFGTPASTTTGAASSGAAPPTFSFGTPSTPAGTAGASTTPASTPAGGAPPFSFNFGKTTTPSTTPQVSPFSTTPAPQNLFGGAPTTNNNAGSTTNSVFGGAAGGGGNIFGAAPSSSSGDQKK